MLNATRGNHLLGLLRRIAPHNDILISYGLYEPRPYIETIKYFLRLWSLWADTRSAHTTNDYFPTS